MMYYGRKAFYRKQKCTNKPRSITWKAMNKTTIHPENIAWIKNVKVKSGKGWAYDEYSCGQTFKLHWPTSKRGSAETPKRDRSEEHTSELQSRPHLVCRLLLEKKKNKQ